MKTAAALLAAVAIAALSLLPSTPAFATGHCIHTLGAHSYVKIHTGHGASTQTDRDWNRNWYIWNNTGDTATLRDSLGGMADSCRCTGTSTGYVFC